MSLRSPCFASKLHHSSQQQSKVPRLLAALKECSNSKDLSRGKEVHAEASSSGDDTNVFVANSLINMYCKCGSMVEARKVFGSMSYHSIVSWNTLMMGYAETGQEDLALELLDRIEDCAVDDVSYVAAFKACTGLAAREDDQPVDGKLVKVAALAKVMVIHARAERNGRGLQAMTAINSLVDAYANCGSMLDSRKVWDRMRHHSVVSWTALIMGYAENNEEELALSLFFLMEARGLEANLQTFLAALKASSILSTSEEWRKVGGNLAVKPVSLERGMALHCEALKKKCDNELYVATSLVQVYVKAGSLIDARRVFDRMPGHTPVSQNSLLVGYVENGEEEVALDLFLRFELEGRESTGHTIVAALKACSGLASKEEAQLVDGKLAKTKALAKTVLVEGRARCKDSFVWNTLVDTYAKCGSMADAHRVFDKMACHNVVSWTALVLGYAENGDGNFALELFERMEPCVANELTYVAALKACTSLSSGRSICDDDSKEVTGTKEQGGGENRGFVDKLAASSQQQQELQLRKVIWIHSRATEAGFTSNILVASSLVDLYARCGRTKQARDVFESMSYRDTVAWNTLIHGYVENGEAEEALECLASMRASRDYRPNAMTFVAALKACTKVAAKEREVQEEEKEKARLSSRIENSKALKAGAEIHSEAAEFGLDLDASVGNALVEMYAKCGSMLDSQRVFDRIASSPRSRSSPTPPPPTSLAWNLLITGYAENGKADRALELFLHYRSIDERREPLVFVAALKACGVLANLAACKAIHAEIARAGMEQRETMVTNCLVDSYGKCGSATAARLLFDSLSALDTVTWNSLITGYGKLGDAGAVLEAFRMMTYAERYRADEITFVAVLAACSHGGLVDRGTAYFRKMLSEYGVRPQLEHYTCAVDMLARANRLAEAAALARDVERGSAMMWRALLGACRKWGDVELGKVAFEALVRMDGVDSAAFALMANIYGSAGVGGERLLPREVRDGRRILIENIWECEQTGDSR